MYEALQLQGKMRRSYLIQRLELPRGKANLVTGSFAPGLGISEEWREALKDVFSYDYMGAAQFEYGAVPAALEFIADQAIKKGLVAGEHRGVFYIAPISYEAGVKKLIEQLIADESSARLLEYCGLKKALLNRDSEKQRVLGWLELDNGFFFFVNRTMFENTKRLFNIA